MKQIAIVGVGFVGSALFKLLKQKFNVLRYDPSKKFSCSKEEVNECDVVFLCVPTPFDWVKKDYDYSAIDECLGWIKRGRVVVIKSTVQPGTTREVARKYKHDIVFNPEFLRQKSAVRDIKGADRVVLGGNKTDCLKISRIYKKVYPRKVKYIHTTFESAELAKIATNAFLCSKVMFCNEIKKFCDKIDIDYDEFRKVWFHDKRIGKSHTEVTKEGGFSGGCFPKDLNALISKMMSRGVDPVFQKMVWNLNRKHRKEFRGRKYER
ncbi:MAG: hypothetical protein ABH810_00945 [bacterium]